MATVSNFKFTEEEKKYLKELKHNHNLELKFDYNTGKFHLKNPHPFWSLNQEYKQTLQYIVNYTLDCYDNPRDCLTDIKLRIEKFEYENKHSCFSEDKLHFTCDIQQVCGYNNVTDFRCCHSCVELKNSCPKVCSRLKRNGDTLDTVIDCLQINKSESEVKY